MEPKFRYVLCIKQQTDGYVIQRLCKTDENIQLYTINDG